MCTGVSESCQEPSFNMRSLCDISEKRIRQDLSSAALCVGNAGGMGWSRAGLWEGGGGLLAAQLGQQIGSWHETMLPTPVRLAWGYAVIAGLQVVSGQGLTFVYAS